MKSKSMRFRWMSNLKKWVVNNLCCVLRKKNRKRQRCEDLESAFGDNCGDVAAFSAMDLSTMTSADSPSSRHADLEGEMANLKLQDLHIVTPLGVGGFGRVILVQENTYSNKTYALKIISKQHIISISQQKQVVNEKNIMTELRSDFIVRLLGYITVWTSIYTPWYPDYVVSWSWTKYKLKKYGDEMRMSVSDEDSLGIRFDTFFGLGKFISRSPKEVVQIFEHLVQ